MKQLLYPAAWLTFSLGLNIIGAFIVDLFPRNKYMSFGILGCMACLIVEAALVANFVPSTNESALQAAVAMFFVFQIFYGCMLDGNSPPLPFPPSPYVTPPFTPRHTNTNPFPRNSILLPRRDLPDAPPRKRRLPRRSNDLLHEYHLAPSRSHCLPKDWLEVLFGIYYPRNDWGCGDVDLVAGY